MTTTSHFLSSLETARLARPCFIHSHSTSVSIPGAQRVWVCVHANGCATGVHVWVVWRRNYHGNSSATLKQIHHDDHILTPKDRNATHPIARFCWQPPYAAQATDAWLLQDGYHFQRQKHDSLWSVIKRKDILFTLLKAHHSCNSPCSRGPR